MSEWWRDNFGTLRRAHKTLREFDRALWSWRGLSASFLFFALSAMALALFVPDKCVVVYEEMRELPQYADCDLAPESWKNYGWPAQLKPLGYEAVIHPRDKALLERIRAERALQQVLTITLMQPESADLLP